MRPGRSWRRTASRRRCSNTLGVNCRSGPCVCCWGCVNFAFNLLNSKLPDFVISPLVTIPHAACCVVDCLPLIQPRRTPCGCCPRSKNDSQAWLGDNSASASADSRLPTFSAPTWHPYVSPFIPDLRRSTAPAANDAAASGNAASASRSAGSRCAKIPRQPCRR